LEDKRYEKEISSSSIIYGTLFRSKRNNISSGSPSANNSSTTTSQTTTAATEVKVEQKAITQDALNDVQKEKLSGYFTDMAAIDNDTTLTAEQKVEKKAAAVQTMINSVLGLNIRSYLISHKSKAICHSGI